MSSVRSDGLPACEECGAEVVRKVDHGVFECLACGEFFEEDDYARTHDTLRRRKYEGRYYGTL